VDILNHKMSTWLVAEVERVDWGGCLLYVDVLTISSLRAMSATQSLCPLSCLTRSTYSTPSMPVVSNVAIYSLLNLECHFSHLKTQSII